jgi:alkylated DNA repair dioxygenase AlkB
VGFAKSKAKVAPKIDGELADLRDAVCEFLARELEIDIEFNQCIVNEYLRDQGIGGHVDHVSFGPIVVSVSLGADCEFVFEHVKTGEKRSFWVPRRSLLLLTEESRYEWKHSVPNRIGMNCDGVKIARGAQWRRVSATFRVLE